MTRTPPAPLGVVSDTAGPQHDPLCPACRQVLALFDGPLAEVRFPDLDRPTLIAAAGSVTDAQLEVERLQRALDEARARTADANARLTELATLALAYARVYAQRQPELEASISAIGLGNPGGRAGAPLKQRGRGGRRGRPPKDSATAELLSTVVTNDN